MGNEKIEQRKWNGGIQKRESGIERKKKEGKEKGREVVIALFIARKMEKRF